MNTIGQAVKHVDLFIAPSEFTKNKHLEMGLRIPIVELPTLLPAGGLAGEHLSTLPGRDSVFSFCWEARKT